VTTDGTEIDCPACGVKVQYVVTDLSPMITFHPCGDRFARDRVTFLVTSGNPVAEVKINRLAEALTTAGMSEPRIVTPEEAQEWLDSEDLEQQTSVNLSYTVATEPDRIRAAVVEALRNVYFPIPPDAAEVKIK
jgi:hypothetical protein